MHFFIFNIIFLTHLYYFLKVIYINRLNYAQSTLKRLIIFTALIKIAKKTYLTSKSNVRVFFSKNAKKNDNKLFRY